ncbi:hypothetical protein C8J56DRAFT_1077889 [Mycena floridula]|nr:hypothetical protein C8J56DRAFT_1077889 [Mycena floridula]
MPLAALSRVLQKRTFVDALDLLRPEMSEMSNREAGRPATVLKIASRDITSSHVIDDRIIASYGFFFPTTMSLPKKSYAAAISSPLPVSSSSSSSSFIHSVPSSQSLPARRDSQSQPNTDGLCLSSMTTRLSILSHQPIDTPTNPRAPAQPVIPVLSSVPAIVIPTASHMLPHSLIFSRNGVHDKSVRLPASGQFIWMHLPGELKDLSDGTELLLDVKPLSGKQPGSRTLHLALVLYSQINELAKTWQISIALCRSFSQFASQPPNTPIEHLLELQPTLGNACLPLPFSQGPSLLTPTSFGGPLQTTSIEASLIRQTFLVAKPLMGLNMGRHFFVPTVPPASVADADILRILRYGQALPDMFRIVIPPNASSTISSHSLHSFNSRSETGRHHGGHGGAPGPSSEPRRSCQSSAGQGDGNRGLGGHGVALCN